MRPIRNMLHILLVIGMGFSLTVFSNGPAQAQTAPGASRSILAFPRPGGFPNPALRVTYARADEAPPLMVRTGENTFEPLYRRTPDGGYAPARAAGYPADLADAWVVEMENCDFARFAPTGSAADKMREAAARVSALIDGLEKVAPERRP